MLHFLLQSCIFHPSYYQLTIDTAQAALSGTSTTTALTDIVISPKVHLRVSRHLTDRPNRSICHFRACPVFLLHSQFPFYHYPHNMVYTGLFVSP